MTKNEAKSILLSPSFTLWELISTTKTDYIPEQLKIPPAYVANLRLLCYNILQPVRDRFGVVIVSSGYRSKSLNKAVGGKPNSAHLYGMAADIITNNMSEVYRYIAQNCDYTQLINEYDYKWLHVSYDQNNLRRQVLKIG